MAACTVPTPCLPTELIEYIISLASQYEYADPMVLDRHFDASKTVVQCIGLCKSTYRFVQRLLFRKCLYFDDADRLRDFVESLDIVTPWGLAMLEKRERSQSMFLEPFQDSLEDSQAIQTLDLLFGILRHHLRRLFISMPLRSMYSYDDAAIHYRPQLRAAFMHLEAIEEFTSSHDELYLAITEGRDEDEVWGRWKSLRRLCLYNCEVDDRFVKVQNALPNFETLMLVRPDNGEPNCWEQLRRGLPKVKILAVNTMSGHAAYFGGDDVLELSPHILGEKDAEVPDVPVADVKAYVVPGLANVDGERQILGQLRDIVLSKKAVKEAALAGELWSWEGVPLKDVLSAPVEEGVVDLGW